MTVRCGRAAGVSIGDVGISSPECYFDFFFNLCPPTDHLVNTYFYLPDGFEPLRLEDGDVEVTPLYFYKGAMITSAGVEVRRDHGLVGSSLLIYAMLASR